MASNEKFCLLHFGLKKLAAKRKQKKTQKWKDNRRLAAQEQARRHIAAPIESESESDEEIDDEIPKEWCFNVGPSSTYEKICKSLTKNYVRE